MLPSPRQLPSNHLNQVFPETYPAWNPAPGFCFSPRCDAPARVGIYGMKMGKTFGVFKTAAKDFSADSAPRLGASLAYYTIFSLSPLLIIVIAIAAFFLGPENSARDQISN